MNRSNLTPFLVRHRDNIGDIELALRVVVVELRQPAFEIGTVRNQNAGVNFTNLALLFTRIFLLHDARNFTVFAGNTAIAGWIVEHDRQQTNAALRLRFTQALQRFHRQFREEPLVVDKWFSLQARRNDVHGEVLDNVKQLMRHPDFVLTNPNRVRNLLSAFCHRNPGAFHRKDAAGYVFWADQVLALDAINTQMAARLARAMDHWKRLAEPYRSAACEAIRRVAARPDLSPDVREIVQRALAD